MARKIKGEAFTTRLEITLDLLLQLIRVDLDDVHLGSAQFLDELATAQTGDLGPSTLGDESPRIPEDRRGPAHLARKPIGRPSQFRDHLLRELE